VATSSRSDRERARRERVEQLRREQRAKERKRTLMVVAGLGVIIAVVIVLVTISLVSSNGSDSGQQAEIIPSTPVGPVTVQKKPTEVPNTSGIKGVHAYDTKGYPAPGKADAGTLEHDHVTGPVRYAVIPPVGGPHNPVWMNAGVYDKPVPSERAVHDMEHGAVWITYRPSLPAGQVDALRAFVGKQTLIDESQQTQVPGQSNRFMDLSPWASDALPAPIVISSWGYQLQVNSPTDSRLQAFVDKFRRSTTYTPEAIAPVDGQPVETSGRALMYGGTKPNPPGVATGQ